MPQVSVFVRAGPDSSIKTNLTHHRMKLHIVVTTNRPEGLRGVVRSGYSTATGPITLSDPVLGTATQDQHERLDTGFVSPSSSSR